MTPQDAPSAHRTISEAGRPLAVVARGEGTVFVTASIAATVPRPAPRDVRRIKGLGPSFPGGIRHELKDTGVTETSLMPGPSETDRGGEPRRTIAGHRFWEAANPDVKAHQRLH